VRVALCHEWCTTVGGSEKVARAIADAWPVRDVFTFTARAEAIERCFGDRRVATTRLGRHRLAAEHWQWFLPVMAAAWRRLDLSAYDVVLTSSHACVNAVRPRPDARLISYCHTPMRYAWDWRAELGRAPALLRPAWPLVAAQLRRADRRRSRRVELFVANSRFVANRIAAAYGAPAAVVHPPVDTHRFTPAARPGGDHLLLAGRLVAYKRPEVAIEAATRSGRRLVVAGSGPLLARLRARAGPSVRFEPDPDDDRLLELYRHASALVLCGVEDFGIVPVEAQACGVPVVAFDAGGVRETVIDGRTGILYRDPGPDGLLAALACADATPWDPPAIRAHAERFAPERFRSAFEHLRAVVEALAPGEPIWPALRSAPHPDVHLPPAAPGTTTRGGRDAARAATVTRAHGPDESPGPRRSGPSVSGPGTSSSW
jgi:glycosyltransferase involved in cell wall biosynthesis